VAQAIQEMIQINAKIRIILISHKKRRFIGLNQGPASMEKVVHLYNFENRRDRTETPILIQAVLNGAEQAGYMDGIIFLNYE